MKTTAEYYTINNTPVKAAALRQASLVLSLPTGSWPETQQAEIQLAELLPAEVSAPVAMEFAARHTTHIHPSRMDWLNQLGGKYTFADAGKVYPALK